MLPRFFHRRIKAVPLAQKEDAAAKRERELRRRAGAKEDAAVQRAAIQLMEERKQARAAGLASGKGAVASEDLRVRAAVRAAEEAEDRRRRDAEEKKRRSEERVQTAEREERDRTARDQEFATRIAAETERKRKVQIAAEWAAQKQEAERARREAAEERERAAHADELRRREEQAREAEERRRKREEKDRAELVRLERMEAARQQRREAAERERRAQRIGEEMERRRGAAAARATSESHDLVEGFTQDESLLPLPPRTRPHDDEQENDASSSDAEEEDDEPRESANAATHVDATDVAADGAPASTPRPTQVPVPAVRTAGGRKKKNTKNKSGKNKERR